MSVQLRWALLSLVMDWAWGLWCGTGLFGPRGLDKIRNERLRQAVDRVHVEMWPFLPVAIVAGYIAEVKFANTPTVFMLAFVTALKTLVWWLARPHDDDRWRRRRRKLAGKVRVLASGKLAVVPEGGPA